MYSRHFSLREAPFSITPDSAFFYPHEGAQAALNMLLVALRSGEGFLKIVGEVVCGKTVLCRQLLRHKVLNALRDCLLRHAAAGRRVIVCIDEAQAIPLRTVESLRLLSNLETEKRKLLQLVLLGQPELDEKLAACS